MTLLSTVATLVQKIGTSGLGSENELSLLSIAAQDPSAVSDDDFARAFDKAAEDEYAHPDASHLGEQARQPIENVLQRCRWSDPAYFNICRFLYQAATGGGAPPLALPLIISQLPAAIASAQASPGEEWEERNWGGYNISGSEESVDVMSKAVKNLCKADYTPAGWAAMLKGLLKLKAPLLRNVPVGEYS